MRRPLVAGNWKMNGSKEEVELLLDGLKRGCELVEHAELAVFPPFVHLGLCEQELLRTQIMLGVQNICAQPSGAFTGEISAAMVKDFHCAYVLVGHSERRQIFGETNFIVAEKFWAVLQAGLMPILCVGETLEEREADKTWSVIKEQLEAVFSLHDNQTDLDDIVIAYEPIWAIGTGVVASSEQAQTVHSEIRSYLNAINTGLASKVRILYGGSVKPSNSVDLFSMRDIDGALVGGASLKAEDFLEIGKLCNS
jgi:triosephosphate isomerase